jgi:hypothetical protein
VPPVRKIRMAGQSREMEKWESDISALCCTSQDGVRELNPSWSPTLRNLLSSLSSPRTAPSPMRGFFIAALLR